MTGLATSYDGDDEEDELGSPMAPGGGWKKVWLAWTWVRT